MPDDAKPMTDRDIEPAAPGDRLEPAAPIKDENDGAIASAEQKAKVKASSIGQQASDQVRQFVDDGKTKASSALDQIAQLLNDAAGNADDKFGGPFGDYARQAAGSVSGFAARLDERDVDAIVADARTFVRQSPGVAIGIAAALGFVLARAVQSGIDDQARAA